MRTRLNIMRYFLAIVYGLIIVSGIAGQSTNRLTQRCAYPYQQIYSVLQLAASGDITLLPCATRATIFYGNIDFSHAGTIIGLPTGSGTANALTKWTATSTLGDSGITDNGSTVSIGYSSGVTKLLGQNKLVDPTQSPLFPSATNYFIMKGAVNNGSKQYFIGSDQELTITQTVNNPFVIGSYNNIVMNGNYTGGNLWGGYWELSNRGSPNSSLLDMIGLSADVEVDSLAHSATGGFFTAITGGSGGGATPLIVGLDASAGNHNTTNPLIIAGLFELRSGIGGTPGINGLTLGIGVQSKLSAIGGVLTEGRGFSCHEWSTTLGSVTSSSCIYADTSIDTFGTAHYFINSIATSPSKVNGDFAIVNNLKGVILTSPNGTCFRISVDNAGALSTASVTCP